MKNMDYAAMGAAFVAYGAASSAYSEASRAQAGVNQLWKEIQLIRNDINSQKYEREFQRWAEELMYQFSKTVSFISDSPGNPINDCADIASFFRIIEENKINTACVNGLENKEKFEQTLLKAQNLFDNLKTNSQVQDYLRQQEADRIEQERRRAEAAVDNAMRWEQTKRFMWLLLGTYICVAFVFYQYGFAEQVIWVTVAIIVLVCMILYQIGKWAD